ncbi:alkaline phosphatase family protein [Rhizohabitans arisaemae]|uniref:alkaline phosphatase family protein n=1 Tax=Rhizohabitans arisaemae TaxID=2720610 RepID=UPI0024B04146|nr:nucleotide pyrophosphatase/phosphodiesterase family protein [Rhizohabitans arisaemae]
MIGPFVPDYGRAALTDFTPAVLAALGVSARETGLRLDPVRRVCVLLVDGMGSELLRAHPEAAPFLSSLAGGTLTAGFPATTATSLGSIGTGLTPGDHGLLGCRVDIPGQDRLLSFLHWTDEVDPEEWQPQPTVFERAVADGVQVTYVGPARFEGTGLTRAVYRGARYFGADDPLDRVAAAHRALRDGERSFVFVYYADLDRDGHDHGWGSPEWLRTLTFVDGLAARIAEGLPRDAALYITADHGMVNVTDRVDFDLEPDLQAGVVRIGGDTRARYLYTEEGAARAVHETWSEFLRGRAWVMHREEAVEAGWYGRRVLPGLLTRVGDVIVVPYGECGIISSVGEARASLQVGMHGSLTKAEQNVPLLEVSTR